MYQQLSTAPLSPRTLFLLGSLVVFVLAAQFAPHSGLPPQVPALPDLQPLAFIENQGQAGPDVQMQALGFDGTLAFLPHEVALTLPAADREPVELRVQFDGAATTRISGGEPLAERVNLFLGADPANWRTGLPTYAALNYHDLYAGIDLRYDGRQGRLKGTYTVAPGVEPGVIRWRYSGATHVTIEQQSGDLLITLADGRTLREHAPIAWQDMPDGRRMPVAAHFTLDAGVAGFTLGSYNSALPLVIDPTLVYSTFLGGNELEYGADIAVDGQGNLYVVGDTSSLNFPLTNPLLEPGQRGTDLFVTKLSPTGQRLFSTYLGGGGSDYGHALALDTQGNLYLTGSTTSGDFPLQNPFQDAVNGNSDAFVVKLNAADNQIVFASYFGGNGDENGLRISGVAPGGIVVDANGNVVIVGLTNSDDLPTVNPLQATFGGGNDAFIAKIDLDPAQVLYADYLGGSADDFATDVDLDTNGNIYLSGTTQSNDFPVRNAIQPETASDGSNDAFLAKLNASGSAYAYATYIGGDGSEEGAALAVAGDGSVYLTGSMLNSTNFPLVGAIAGLGEQGDGYVVKLAPSGQQISYSARFGGSGRIDSYDIALGPDGSVYLTGVTASLDFPVLNALQTTLSGDSDAFVTRINAAGCRVVASTYFGGSSFENSEASAGALAVDGQGAVYITGSTSSTNFPLANAQQPNYAGKTDAFVAKLTLDGDSECGGYQLYLPLLSR